MSFCSGKHGCYHDLCVFFITLVLIVTATTAAEDPSTILSRFQQYLQINTAQPHPNYYEAAEFIISQAKLLSLESQTLEFVKGKPLILLKWPGNDPTLPSILLNSHTDVVPSEHHKWTHPPFSAHLDSTTGNIFARGSQDMKCVGLQYLEAIRKLKASGFRPMRTLYLSFLPDEEIGGNDGAGKFVDSDVFAKMNVGIVLDEGLASPTDNYRAFYGERSPWWLVVKAVGAPGHGAKLYDNTAMENLLKSIEIIRRFRAAQFDLVKAGQKAEGEVISVNMVFLKAGTPSPSGFVMNLQPSEAQAGFDIRVPPTADQASLERRIADEWAPASRNMTFEDEENAKAISLFEDVVHLNDAIEDEAKRMENLVKGIFAGNLFDLGSAQLAELFSRDGISFLASFQNLVPRPWVIDDLDTFITKWSKESWKKAVIFVDNSGADIILGILPFTRELLRHGTQVILAANDLPSINDVTYPELVEIISKLKDEQGKLVGVDTSNLLVANSGNDLPVIDLMGISQELAYLASDADLVILEGMGRGIETNLYAQFRCDSLKIGMVKHPEVVEFLGGRLYDCVFKYNEVLE